MRLDPCLRTRVTRRVGAALVIFAIRKTFPVGVFHLKSRGSSCSTFARCFDTMISATKNDNGGVCGGFERDPFPNLKVFDPKELREYYEETKRILLTQGNDNAKGDTQSCLSSLSVKLTKNRNSYIASRKKTFSLQHFEPRHRRSMMRCVLNHCHFEHTTKSTPLVSKLAFQQHLRSLERKQRWRITRVLLFGDISFEECAGNEETQQYWWESGVIKDESAPGLRVGIQEYRASWGEEKDPRKFLSRLASGRAYKGNFRSLLEDYVSSSNMECKVELISLYDQITGSDTSRKLSFDETNRRELELLHLFIDELEENTKAADNSEDQGGNHEELMMEPSTLVLSSEQICLLRSICSLDIFSAPPQSRSGVLSNGIPSVGDGGRSLGKKGERDLKSFLVRKHEARETTRVLSPVWVRPKDKNRRHTKEKCQYVLEIPRMQDDQNNGGNNNHTRTKNNGFVSHGTTSEFDAMVVRIINSDKNDESNDRIIPIMAIRQVWDAKATLDPSALLDVLDKKTRSIKKILCDNNSNVVNLADASMSGETTSYSGVEDGANFVILPPLENKNNPKFDTSTNRTSPMFYRVGIEPPKAKSKDACYESIPQIGVFANKMIDPRAAARRIQTIVYEGLLETDLSTVKGVVNQHQGNGGACFSALDGDGRLRSNHLLQERSVEIVERILRLIDTVKPIVVVETYR